MRLTSFALAAALVVGHAHAGEPVRVSLARLLRIDSPGAIAPVAAAGLRPGSSWEAAG